MKHALSAAAAALPFLLLSPLGAGSPALAAQDFGPQQVITTAADAAVSVYAVDLDGDGDADVLSASQIDDKIAWYENYMNDCNDNGVNDIDDIASGTSTDCNADGVPDECQLGGNDLDQNGVLDVCEYGATTYCSTSPNSVGSGALIGYSGSLSISGNGFLVTASDCPPGQFGVFYFGLGQAALPFGDGVRCVTGGGLPINRLAATAVDFLGNAGSSVDLTAPLLGGVLITPASTWNFQFWYRDPAAGGAGFNLSDALEVTFAP